VEDEGLPSGAALTLKDKPNKEPMQKLKEQDDTTEKEEMAQTQLHFIKYASEEIIEFIEMGGEIEEWYQNKLSKVHSDMEGLHSYIEGEKRRTGMVKEEEVDESIASAIGGALGRYAGEKVGLGPAAQAHGEVAGRMIDYHARKLFKKAKKVITGESVELDEEEYDSVPASKSLQKAHDDERKRRGLPDPDYYLKLRDQKKKEIEDMKKEEVELHEISKKTLGSYISKASSSAVSHGRTAGVELGAGGQKRKDIYNREEGKAEKRLSGIRKAVSKLSKEEVELDEVKEPTGDLKDACWKGYTAVGMKMKNGRKVPNCVPVKEGYYKSQEIERQETERLKPPFTPDKPKKQAIAGKQGAGYSTARHLARQAMKKYTKPVKESLEESRRSEIIKEIVKKKKNEDKFNAEPIISDTVTKND
jgi:hypothetical protein